MVYLGTYYEFKDAPKTIQENKKGNVYGSQTLEETQERMQGKGLPVVRRRYETY